ncbi:hypothetical protein GA0074695_1756 [Micromonospora viridifaciens]|uniref:Uncharacterized protein n=1 Tax=Micromonospora viridifaciens TaxID=1881 RepID=A0A1C4VSS2_MICVI|nr:hypothetical protein GA0074695_1756 [Micromonospora viridifaciens]
MVAVRHRIWPRGLAVHAAGVGIHSPIEPLYQEVAAFLPDRLARIHENRLIQYEVAPAINQREAFGLFG